MLQIRKWRLRRSSALPKRPVAGEGQGRLQTQSVWAHLRFSFLPLSTLLLSRRCYLFFS